MDAAAARVATVTPRGLTPLWTVVAAAFVVLAVLVGVLVGPIELGIGPEPHLTGLDEADALDAAGDDDVHAVDDDLLCRGRDRHQA